MSNTDPSTAPGPEVSDTVAAVRENRISALTAEELAARNAELDSVLAETGVVDDTDGWPAGSPGTSNRRRGSGAC